LRLEQQRTVLRYWCTQDLEAYGAWLQPGHEWQQLDGPYYPRANTPKIQKKIEALRERIEKAQWPTPCFDLAVVDRQSDRLIGRVSRYWQSEETLWLSIGITIFDPRDWGRGLGFEALGGWTGHLFNSMPELLRLDLRTWSGNRGMMRLAEKLGFREEARFRRARIVDGEPFDGMGYGILREEWTAAYPDGFRP
jgi:putative hydrolase of HD superfamily